MVDGFKTVEWEGRKYAIRLRLGDKLLEIFSLKADGSFGRRISPHGFTSLKIYCRAKEEGLV